MAPRLPSKAGDVFQRPSFILGQRAEAQTLRSALWLGFLKREYLSNLQCSWDILGHPQISRESLGFLHPGGHSLALNVDLQFLTEAALLEKISRRRKKGSANSIHLSNDLLELD